MAKAVCAIVATPLTLRRDRAILKDATRVGAEPAPIPDRLRANPHFTVYVSLGGSRSRALTTKVVPGARLDNRVRSSRQWPEAQDHRVTKRT